MAEQPDVDDGAAAGAGQCPGDETADQGESTDQRDEDPGVGEARAALDPGEAVHEGGAAGGEQEQAERVQRCAGAAGDGPVVGQVAQGEPGADGAEGDVDEEQPAPVGQMQDQTAEYGPEDRTEGGGHGDDRHDLADVAAPGRLHEQCGHQRHHDAGGGTLEDPEGDQAGRVPGQRAQQRAEQEPAEGRHPQPTSAEPRLRPAGQRDGDEHGEQIAGAHPLDGGERGAEVLGQVVEGDADDGGVQDDGEGADDEGDRHPPHGWVHAVGVCATGVGAVGARAVGARAVGSAHERQPP